MAPMAKILIVLASGPEHEARAREGLSLARAIHEIGMAESIRILLTGPGVRCLDPEADELREGLEGALEAGVPVAACTRSLDAYRLLDAAADLEAVQPVGAPVYLATRAEEGYAFLTF
jgi:hypothetical protein